MAKTKKKHPGGRPRIPYDSKLHPIVAKLHFAGGGTVEQLVEQLGVSKDTLYRWKKSHKEFCESWTAGMYDPTAKVMGAVYKRALGCEVTEERLVFRDGEPETVTVTKHLPPDVPAAKLWLFNRDPENWKEKQEVHVTTDEIEIGAPPEEYPDDES